MKLYTKDLQTGDIVFFRTKFKVFGPMTWLAAFIRFFDSTRYNHVEVAVKNWGRFFINGAIETGVVSVPIVDRIKNKTIVVCRMKYHEPLSKNEEEDLATRANLAVGKTPYDFSSLLFFQLVYRITGKWIGRKKEKAINRMYCGEYVAWVHDIFFREWWKTSPGDILKRRDEMITIFEGYVTEIIGDYGRPFRYLQQ